MNDQIQDLLRSVQNTPDFGYVDFHSINDTNALGDNALHCVCSWGDMDAARVLVENGINLNQRGELGFTPLNVAMVFGHLSLAGYLLAQGADPLALETEPCFDRERQIQHVKRLAEHIRELEHHLDLGLCLAPLQRAVLSAVK
jgi:ankyrin repeat protein